MKRVLIFAIPLLLSLSLFGCGTDMDSNPDVEGYVLKTDKDRVLVAEDISSEKFEEIKDKTVSEFREHTSQQDKLELMFIDYDDAGKFEKGNKIKAWLDGGVNDSYPAQAKGEKISDCNGTFSNNTDENGGLSGDSPPSAYIKMNNKKYDTKLGSYCWKTGCVDKVGLVELLKDREPIQVQAGESITFGMEYTPKPNEVHLSQIINDKKTNVELKGNQFTAPKEKGIYYYNYSVWWMDKEKDNVSHGDASYAFVLEVK
ncbi:hypothetical protein GCM10008983_18660 [Lentibacillus halophilus]|uniref:Lipoprotein n=1 Tax=Lentibacillus halophilus TaxID=295065 RepID=A0ABN0ZBB9_9BACI